MTVFAEKCAEHVNTFFARTCDFLWFHTVLGVRSTHPEAVGREGNTELQTQCVWQKMPDPAFIHPSFTGRR